MSATISASVKFWPEIRTVPLSVEADDAVVGRGRAAVGAAAGREERGTSRHHPGQEASSLHWIPPSVSRVASNGARVRCPPLPGRGAPIMLQRRRSTRPPGRSGPGCGSLTIRVHRALHEGAAHLEQERHDGHDERGGDALGVVGAIEAFGDQDAEPRPRHQRGDRRGRPHLHQRQPEARDDQRQGQRQLDPPERWDPVMPIPMADSLTAAGTSRTATYALVKIGGSANSDERDQGREAGPAVGPERRRCRDGRG